MIWVHVMNLVKERKACSAGFFYAICAPCPFFWCSAFKFARHGFAGAAPFWAPCPLKIFEMPRILLWFGFTCVTDKEKSALPAGFFFARIFLPFLLEKSRRHRAKSPRRRPFFARWQQKIGLFDDLFLTEKTKPLKTRCSARGATLCFCKGIALLSYFSGLIGRFKSLYFDNRRFLGRHAAQDFPARRAFLENRIGFEYWAVFLNWDSNKKLALNFIACYFIDSFSSLQGFPILLAYKPLRILKKPIILFIAPFWLLVFNKSRSWYSIAARVCGTPAPRKRRIGVLRVSAKRSESRAARSAAHRRTKCAAVARALAHAQMTLKT